MNWFPVNGSSALLCDGGASGTRGDGRTGAMCVAVAPVTGADDAVAVRCAR
jgi:hypothetical protein